MAEDRGGTTMTASSSSRTSSTCEWVRQRLPLLAGDEEASTGERRDLDAADRDRIEHHLDGCPACRKRRQDLGDVLSILAAAASEPPAGPEALSVSSAVARRLEGEQPGRPSRWSRIARVFGLRVEPAPDRASGLGRLRGELPLQLAWVADSLGEVFSGRSGSWRFGLPGERAVPFRRLSLEARFGLGLAAIALAMAAYTLIERRHFQAEARIALNARPVPRVDLAARNPAGEPAVEASSDEAAPPPVGMLAQADPPSAADPALANSPAAARPAAAVASPAAVAATPAPRYDFDLEQGTPMPLESRGGRLAY